MSQTIRMFSTMPAMPAAESGPSTDPYSQRTDPPTTRPPRADGAYSIIPERVTKSDLIAEIGRLRMLLLRVAYSPIVDIPAVLPALREELGRSGGR